MPAEPHPAAWKTLSAFAIVYLFWGATFLAIRIGVHEVPPFLFAALRFLAAGLILYLWTVLRGERSPTGRQWLSIVAIAVLIFVFDYGLLFWAEQRVPSGVAAIMLATIPAFMALSEIVLLRTQRLSVRLSAALLVGLTGVAVLVSRSLVLGGAPIDTLGAIALIVAPMSWSIAGALTLKLPMPPSKTMTSGAQMLAGGVLLSITAVALGEFHDFHPSAVSAAAWLSLLYLIVPGSIIAFTAYIWLIHHQSPTKVGTYAYVNPVIAILLGYFVAGEPLGLRTILGSVCVLISVVLITTTRTKKSLVAVIAEEAD